MKKLFSAFIAVLIVVISMVPAFAVVSPQATTRKYQVIVIPPAGGDGSVVYESDIDDEGNEHIKVEATPDPGKEFDHWEIEGPATPNGSLTDPKLDITVFGDVKITPVFKDKNGQLVTGTVNVDTSGKSPQTGANDAIPFAIIFLSVAACATAGVMLVKSKKCN